MAAVLVVSIDLPLLAANLRALENTAITDADVLDFLGEARFHRVDGGYWRCEAVSLRVLDPSEYKIVASSDANDGTSATNGNA